MLLLLAVSACALRSPPRHAISMSAGTPIRRRQLGTSDLVVSDVCLGTMTWGKQNTLEEGVQQLDCAFDEYGLNFLDSEGQCGNQPVRQAGLEVLFTILAASTQGESAWRPRTRRLRLTHPNI